MIECAHSVNFEQNILPLNLYPELISPARSQIALMTYPDEFAPSTQQTKMRKGVRMIVPPEADGQILFRGRLITQYNTPIDITVFLNEIESDLSFRKTNVRNT